MVEIAFENGRISNIEGLVTLTLDRVILHTIMHHSSTSTYLLNFSEVEKTFCGRTDVRTHAHMRPALLSRLCQRVDLIIMIQYPSCTDDFMQAGIRPL